MAVAEEGAAAAEGSSMVGEAIKAMTYEQDVVWEDMDWACAHEAREAGREAVVAMRLGTTEINNPSHVGSDARSYYGRDHTVEEEDGSGVIKPLKELYRI
ncbi:hypothetical protein BHE74_00033393 [Ensete ventricosum]|nr:hypothetical protein GW17_00024734 [Ensete ventricosum]RWW59658.1 hypothetical protein BHE74_00033393 [Ensete ventricosum]RZS08338.1 hypothetical protein BHM03_00039293 [Ensete ventricosum]